MHKFNNKMAVKLSYKLKATKLQKCKIQKYKPQLLTKIFVKEEKSIP